MGYGILARFITLDKKPLPPEPDPSTDAIPDGYSYEQLAKRAGFNFADRALDTYRQQTRARQFRHFLSENGITVYDHNKVWMYMNSITPSGQTWRWYGVTKAGDWGRAYTRIIPEAVLLTMIKIREAFLDVEFEVTDYETPRPDPFLRCRIPDSEWYIIEKWDEPRFRM